MQWGEALDVAGKSCISEVVDAEGDVKVMGTFTSPDHALQSWPSLLQYEEIIGISAITFEVLRKTSNPSDHICDMKWSLESQRSLLKYRGKHRILAIAFAI